MIYIHLYTYTQKYTYVDMHTHTVCRDTYTYIIIVDRKTKHSNAAGIPDDSPVIKSVSKLVFWKLKSTTKNKMQV